MIDIEAIATHIGRDIAEDNYDVEREDISSNEVWAHVTIFRRLLRVFRARCM